MARRKAALGLLLVLLGVADAGAQSPAGPPALEGHRFVFHRPRVIAREYIVQFQAGGTGTLVVDAIDERRVHRVPGRWAWRDERLCLEFPPTFSDCFLLIRNRGFFLMARADTVEKRGSAAADPANYASTGSWGSNPDLIGTGVFIAGQ